MQVARTELIADARMVPRKRGCLTPLTSVATRRPPSLSSSIRDLLGDACRLAQLDAVSPLRVEPLAEVRQSRVWVGLNITRRENSSRAAKGGTSARKRNVISGGA